MWGLGVVDKSDGPGQSHHGLTFGASLADIRSRTNPRRARIYSVACEKASAGECVGVSDLALQLQQPSKLPRYCARLRVHNTVLRPYLYYAGPILPRAFGLIRIGWQAASDLDTFTPSALVRPRA